MLVLKRSVSCWFEFTVDALVANSLATDRDVDVKRVNDVNNKVAHLDLAKEGVIVPVPPGNVVLVYHEGDLL